MYKKLLILFILLFMLSNAFAWCEGNDCNSDWTYRQILELDTEGILTSDVDNEHAILVHVDSTNTDFWTNSEILNDINDVRFTSEETYVETPTPVNYWKLDETSGLTAVDSVGAKNGTISDVNITLGETGQVGTAFDFSGNVNKVEMVNTDDHFNLQTLTFSSWINCDSGAQNGNIVSNTYSDIGANNNGWSLAVNAYGGDVLTLSRYNGYLDNQVIHLASNSIVCDSTWKMVTMVFDTTNTKIYINGLLDAEGTATGATAFDSGNMIMRLGNQMYRNPGYLDLANYEGMLDDVGFWDETLDANEIKYWQGETSGRAV